MKRSLSDGGGDRQTFAREIYEEARKSHGYRPALEIVRQQLAENGYSVPSVRTIERWVKAPAAELNQVYVQIRYRELRARGFLVKAAVSTLAQRFKVSESTIRRAVKC